MRASLSPSVPPNRTAWGSNAYGHAGDDVLVGGNDGINDQIWSGSGFDIIRLDVYSDGYSSIHLDAARDFDWSRDIQLLDLVYGCEGSGRVIARARAGPPRAAVS
jgi:hypothetical protein